MREKSWQARKSTFGRSAFVPSGKFCRAQFAACTSQTVLLGDLSGGERSGRLARRLHEWRKLCGVTLPLSPINSDLSPKDPARHAAKPAVRTSAFSELFGSQAGQAIDGSQSRQGLDTAGSENPLAVEPVVRNAPGVPCQADRRHTTQPGTPSSTHQPTRSENTLPDLACSMTPAAPPSPVPNQPPSIGGTAPSNELIGKAQSRAQYGSVAAGQSAGLGGSQTSPAEARDIGVPSGAGAAVGVMPGDGESEPDDMRGSYAEDGAAPPLQTASARGARRRGDLGTEHRAPTASANIATSMESIGDGPGRVDAPRPLLRPGPSRLRPPASVATNWLLRHRPRLRRSAIPRCHPLLCRRHSSATHWQPCTPEWMAAAT